MVRQERLPHHVWVAVIGAGFAGIGMAAALLKAGVRDVVVLERADALGGTWRDNTYPGCACDIPAHLYSFSFAPNPGWSRTYAAQPEIRDYLVRVAARTGVDRLVRYGAELRDAHWDDARRRWRLRTARGDLTADVLVAGTGPLSEPAVPDLPGLESFGGARFHSAGWRHDHDLGGRRVAVIGTGASAIQFVPEIAARVEHLTVFQRTAPWVVPRGDKPVPSARRALFTAFPAAQAVLRAFSYVVREMGLRAFIGSERMRELATKQASAHLHRQVPDPELRRALTPDYAFGCKRVLISDDYYPALGQRHVRLTTAPIARIEPDAVVTADGERHPVDTIILGTGFRVTDNPTWQRFRGRDGRSMAEVFAAGGPQAHRGTTVPGFPNLFLLVGPNTGLGHNSIVYMIESQIAYVLDALRTMRELGLAAVDVRPEALIASNAQVQRWMAGTVWTSGGCASWYLDRSGRNTTLWPTYTFTFRRQLRRFDRAAFTGFTGREPAPAAEPATAG